MYSVTVTWAFLVADTGFVGLSARRSVSLSVRQSIGPLVRHAKVEHGENAAVVIV